VLSDLDLLSINLLNRHQCNTVITVNITSFHFANAVVAVASTT